MSRPYIFSAEYCAENAVLVPEADLNTAKKGESTPSEIISPQLAREIMERSQTGLFFGPEEVKKVFNIDISEVPPIPFTAEDLEQAETLGQQLVLYVDTASDGTPLTITKMNNLMQGKTSDGGKLLYRSNGADLATDSWFVNEDFATKQTPIIGWRLTAKTELIDANDPNLESKSKNYLEQTDVIINYLKTKVFTQSVMPDKLQQSIVEFEKEKATILANIDTDPQKAGDILERLAITELTRESPAEVIYRLVLMERATGEKLLPVNYTWTRGRSSDGYFVNVGSADARGASVTRDQPGLRHGSLGVSLSRSV